MITIEIADADPRWVKITVVSRLADATLTIEMDMSEARELADALRAALERASSAARPR